jgi:hypothetical protein
MLRCSISRAGRAECPIRHSARQKTELELELGQEFTLAEPSQAQHSIPVTSSSRTRAYEHSPQAELGQPLLAQARLVYMPSEAAKEFLKRWLTRIEKSSF